MTTHSNTTQQLQVAVSKWTQCDEIADAIVDTLNQLGCCAQTFDTHSSPPSTANIVLIYGPYGRFWPIVQRVARLPIKHRPRCVLWHTEGLPDLRLPWWFQRTVSHLRALQEQLADAYPLVPPTAFIRSKMQRFLHVGEILHAQRSGDLNLLADISKVYTHLFTQNDVPALFAPFGVHPGWHKDLKLERDIDVLWMGARATRRRSRLLDQICEELSRYRVKVHVVDNQANPFVFGAERMQLLNRSKITLNLLRTWYDENSLRLCLAIPNRSLVVSEPLLPHVPFYKAGRHYVSAPLTELVSTILHYLDHEQERQEIVEHAYQEITSKLTLTQSISTILQSITASEAVFA